MIFLSVFTFGFLIYSYICNIYFKHYYNNICYFQLYEDISTDEDEDEDVPELDDIPNLKEDDVPELVDISKNEPLNNESSNNKDESDTEILEEEELTEEGDYLLYKRKREFVNTDIVNKIRKSRSF